MSLQFRILPLGSSDGNDVLEKALAVLLSQVQEALKSAYTTVFLTPAGQLGTGWDSVARQRKIQSLPLPYGIETTDTADLVLAFWDEDPEGRESAIWQQILLCMTRQVPCIWISKKTGSYFWAARIAYEPYREEFLKSFCDGFFDNTQWDETPKGSKWIHSVFLAGSRAYSRLLKKVPVEYVSSGAEDSIMKPDCRLPDSDAEAVRKKLTQSYLLYDNRAILFSRYYRGSVYFRALLPLVSTAFLALAFYGDTSYVRTVLNLMHIPADIFAGCFFLLHASLIAFSYYLSGNAVIQSWHVNFLHNRIIAEVLRFYTHVLPFGITLPLSRVFRRGGFREKQSHSEYAVLHSLLRQAESSSPPYREENAQDFLDVLSGYLQNQLDYHCASTERYSRLSKKLQKLEKYATAAGVLLVILRGVLQFALRLLETTSVGPDAVSTLRTLANMAAMLVPAFASYYAGKRALLGLDDSYAVDQAMMQRLEKALELVETMRNHELSRSMLCSLTENLSELLLGNVSAWEQEMQKKKVKPL